MFPPSGATIYRNEAGESLGWDVPDDGPYDPDAYLAGDYEDEDGEPGEDDGMHDYEPTDEDDPNFDSPCGACGAKPGASELHW